MSQYAPLIRLPLPADGPLEPPPDWKRLREQYPVATVELPSGDTGILLTRHDHVKALLSDPRSSRVTAEDTGARIAPEGAGGVSTSPDMALPVPLKGPE
ncbi:cytochrome P450, partial [Streptomyces sp. NPDC002920]